MNAIEIVNLNKSYKGFALKNINLTLPSGCIMGLVGENGAGKSTTIKSIMNTIKRDSGAIKVLGVDNTTNEFLKVKEDIGIVLDEATFPETMTAKDVNNMMKYIYTNWDEKIYFDYIKKFSLPLEKQIKEYSRGMTMKLTTAVALSHNVKLLVLDEATGGLDPIVRDEILDIYNDFTRSEEHSILISSHIISDLEKICDYIAFIHNGEIVLCEEKDVLKATYAIIHTNEKELLSLDKNAIIGIKKNEFSIDALVKRNLIPNHITMDNATIEDIILFIIKGGNK